MNPPTKPQRRVSAHPGFWMRSVQFAGLHRILHRLAGEAAGLRASHLNRLIVQHRDYWTDRGEPSKTTLYHCRATLLHLGLVERATDRLMVARRNKCATQLLEIPSAVDRLLPRIARDTFSSIVLANSDCHANLFRLFLARRADSIADFRDSAGSVVWRSLADEEGQLFELRSESSGERIRLSAPVQVQSVIYGVRDWACKQLGFLDEFYETGRGSVLFPVRHPDCADAGDEVLRAMLEIPPDSAEWTTVSVAGLHRRLCESDGFAVRAVHAGISGFVRAHPGSVSLIATIPNFAAIAATSRKQADFQLKSAYRDEKGRIISHLRFHESVREHQNGQKNANAQNVPPTVNPFEPSRSGAPLNGDE